MAGEEKIPRIRRIVRMAGEEKEGSRAASDAGIIDEGKMRTDENLPFRRGNRRNLRRGGKRKEKGNYCQPCMADDSTGYGRGKMHKLTKTDRPNLVDIY